MNKRQFKNCIYGELALVAKAMANPHRLEIIDLLAQGPFSVEQIAEYAGMPIANASQHLQILKKARLVTINRNGNFILYSLSGMNVFKAWAGLRELGFVYNSQIEELITEFRGKHNSNDDAIDAETLAALLEKDEVILLDLRPEEEFHRGHIHKAISVPLAALRSYLKKLPNKKMIVAYCRGPFCVFADEAVQLLKKKGYRTRRMDEGYPEWKMKGYPVVSNERVNCIQQV